MRMNGLKIAYENGINRVVGATSLLLFPVGELLCRIFQGETLDNISRILKNCINACPMNENVLTQDEIENAERYILQVLLYDDFYPAQRLAQGSFVRCMEEYRALDSETLTRFLYFEQMRASENTELFSNIGVETVGDYLRLCYNNYIIDLMNAISLFRSMAAVKSGTASCEENESYESMCQELANSADVIPGIEMQTVYDSGGFEYQFIINSFLAMAVFEFSHMDSTSTKILRCQNPACGKFFTAKRKSAKYCSFASPQNTERPCNDYYPQLLHRAKVKEDRMLKLEKKAYSRLYMDRRRHPEAESEITSMISKIQIESPEKRKQLSEKEYHEWLEGIRRPKGEIYNE